MNLLDGLKVVVLADRLVDFGGSILARLGANVVLADASQMTEPRKKAWHQGMVRSTDDVEKLLADADILLDDRRRTQRKEIDTLAAKHKRLIHIVVTGFPEGYGEKRPVTDLTLMAQSGLMGVIGTPDRPPLRLPGEQAYALTGIQVATAALMGVRARRLTGKGHRISVSALQSTALANYREAVMYECTGKIGKRKGNILVRGKSGVRQIWPCQDGYVTWAMIDNPSMMRAIVRIMKDEGFAGELVDIEWDSILVADTDQAIIERWQEIVAKFFTLYDRQTLADWSLKHGWGLSPIIKASEVPTSPQMQARGIFKNGSNEPTGPLFVVHAPNVEVTS